MIMASESMGTLFTEQITVFFDLEVHVAQVGMTSAQ